MQCKGSTLISQLFEDPEYWSGSGNRTTTSRSAVKRSTDRANPVAVHDIILIFFCQSRESGDFHTERLNTIYLRSILDVRLDQEARMVQGDPTAMIRKMTVKIQHTNRNHGKTLFYMH